MINCTGSGIDHAVTLVAHGTDAATGQPFWTIKNSWGPDFGESSPPGQAGKGARGYARAGRQSRRHTVPNRIDRPTATPPLPTASRQPASSLVTDEITPST